MTQYDKDYISRIQLSQLATGDPYADDFYYQVYSSLRQRAGLPTWQSTHTQDRRGKDNMSQRMQQQLQRIVNDAKRRPKLAQVSLEGALGKITSLTVRNPRQVLQVPSAHTEKQSEDETTETVNETTTPDAATPPPAEPKSKVYSKRSVLKLVEDIYTILLELEQMRRQGPPKVAESDERRGDAEVLAIDASEVFRQKYNSKLDSLWATLRLTKKNQDVPLLIVILSVPKGKKLIPRIVRQLGNEQNLELLHVVLAHFSKLDVSRNVIYPGTMVADVPEAQQQPFVSFEDVELFFSVTMPSLLTLIAESSLQVVNQLLHVVDHTIVHSKPGMAFLTMLLSRGEILKQGGGALQGLQPPSAEELDTFKERYQSLFQSLQGRYLSIFPSLYYLVPINPNTPMIQIVLGVDDMYVWQFLAALAVGASMDQQHILVTEVR
jgi:DNA topoisomerase 2-associated protein PAT1